MGVSKKMFGPEDEEREFGWTNVGCRHDDTYVTSDSCRATRYQDALERRGLEATCFNFDILAVKCFESKFELDVRMKVSRKKMTCNPMLFKEDMRVNLGDMEGLQAKFLLDGDELDIENVFFHKKKGFTAKVDLRGREFECASCEVYAADGDVLVAEGEWCKEDKEDKEGDGEGKEDEEGGK